MCSRDGGSKPPALSTWQGSPKSGALPSITTIRTKPRWSGTLCGTCWRKRRVLFSDALSNPKGSPLERIENLAAKLTELFAEWASLGRMLLDLWATSGAMFKPFFGRIRRDLAQLVAEGQRVGEIDRRVDAGEAASAVIAIIDGMLLQMIVDRAAFGDVAATRRLLVRSVRRILQP